MPSLDFAYICLSMLKITIMNPLFKNTLFLIFFLSNTFLNAQETDTRVRAEADEDWANGTAKYHYSVGKARNEKIDYRLYLEHLGVFLTFYECLRPPESYNIRIEEKLKEKYGRDMITTLKKDAGAFYDSLDRLTTRKAIFSKGEKQLLEAFRTMAYFFKEDGKSKDLSNNFKITLSFTVNPKGKGKNIRFTQTENLEFNKNIACTFKRFFKYNRWLPAKQNGVRVAEEKAFEIVFNPD